MDGKIFSRPSRAEKRRYFCVYNSNRAIRSVLEHGFEHKNVLRAISQQILIISLTFFPRKYVFKNAYVGLVTTKTLQNISKPHVFQENESTSADVLIAAQAARF